MVIKFFKPSLNSHSLSAHYRTEEVRFELTKRFHVYTLSKRAPSATRTLLQETKSQWRITDLGLSAQDLKLIVYSQGPLTIDRVLTIHAIKNKPCVASRGRSIVLSLVMLRTDKNFELGPFCRHRQNGLWGLPN